VAVSYKRGDGYLGLRAMTEAFGRYAGYVAQFARGCDYHVVLRRMLNDLLVLARQQLQEDFAARVCVDTAPLLEREHAVAAGLGWFGRNTCLLNAHWGSYLLLGEIVTTLELVPDVAQPARCGRCQRCLQACPTGALVAPYQLDARRCISYLTIEHRGPISAELQSAIGHHVFGCDICQQVCPYNAKAPLGRHPLICAPRLPERLDLLELAAVRAGAYRRLVADSAGRRASRAQWRRNAIIALGNVAADDPRVQAVLHVASGDRDPGIAAAAINGRRAAASGPSAGSDQDAPPVDST